jgi:hypothetical protein
MTYLKEVRTGVREADRPAGAEVAEASGIPLGS